MSQVQTNLPHLLLLAGSGESRVLARALCDRSDLRVTASLLRPDRSFGPLPVTTRFGGFGGATGLKQYLLDEQVTAVLDATHPFASRISHHAATACAELDLPFAQVLRPEWRARADDNWIHVADEAKVRNHLVAGQRVFSTTGRATLEALASDCSVQIFLRRMVPDTPPDKMAHVTYVIGKGPFTVEQEIETLKHLQIEVLVVKNSGGNASRSKLDAARALKMPVILIARPPQPDALRFETSEAALDWVARL